MKRIENQKVEFILALLLEIVEFGLIGVLNCYVFNVNVINYISIVLIYGICKIIIKRLGYRNSHYKISSYFDAGWRQCLLYTTLFITACVNLTHISFLISVLGTIFFALITSNIMDIEDLTQGKKIDFKVVYSWVRRNQTDIRIIAYENSIKTDGFKYKIYRDVFLGYSTKESCALDLGYDQSNRIDLHIAKMIGSLEQLIPEIEDLNK